MIHRTTMRLGCKVYLAMVILSQLFWFNGKAGVAHLEVSSIVVFRQRIPKKESIITQKNRRRATVNQGREERKWVYHQSPVAHGIYIKQVLEKSKEKS